MVCVSILTIPSISSHTFTVDPLLKPPLQLPVRLHLRSTVRTPLKSPQSIHQKISFKSNPPRSNRRQVSSSLNVSGGSTSTNHDEEKEEISRSTLIWRAIKLPIYSVALIPLAVGSATSYLQAGLFSARRFFLLLSSSVLIITWLNLSNDVYDFDTGADKNKKESVVNLLKSRTGTLIAAYTFLALGFMGLAHVCSEAGDIRSILLLTCAIFLGYIYQCPPFRLSYRGLGEPLCFAAFGPFSTTAYYLMHSNRSVIHHLPITSTILSASVLVGFTTTLILFCSHFHQVDEDLAVGKMSPLVRIGTKAGSQVVKVAIVTLYSLLFAFGLSKLLPFTCVAFCALTLPIAKLVVNYVENNYADKTKIFMAKYYCVRLHAIFGALLSLGLVVGTSVTKSYIPRLVFP